MSGKPINPVKRFFDKVRQTEYCWEWLGAKTPSGYGKIRVNNKCTYAHRYSYFFYYGKFDESLLVCHSCDNPSCVNPGHLFIGTYLDNAMDMSKKGRGHRGKLSAIQINDILSRIRNGEKKRKIAREYKLSEALINNIWTGKIYLRERVEAGRSA